MNSLTIKKKSLIITYMFYIFIILHQYNPDNKWGWGKASYSDFFNEKVILSAGSVIGIFTINYDEISEYTFDDFVQDFTIIDSFLFVVNEEKGIYKLKFLSNLSIFKLLDSLKINGTALRISKFNDSVLIALSNNHIYSLSINGLEVLDSLFISGQPQELYIKDTLIYSGCGYAGLIIFSFANNKLTNLGGYSLNIEYGVQPTIFDSICYLANASQGFIVLNVKNPSNPVFIKTVNVSDYCVDLFIKDTILYALGFNTLKIFSLSNPANPLFLKSYNYGGRRFSFKDTLMNIIDVIKFKTYNIKNPFNISQIASMDASDMVMSFSFIDSTIISSNFFTGINIFNDTLKHFLNLKNVGVPIYTNIYKNYLYIVNFFSGIYVFNLKNFSVDKYFDLVGSENSIVFYDTLGFVACREGGIRVINIKDVFNIREITYNSQKNVTNISNYKNYIYAALGNEGIGIYKFSQDTLNFISLIPSIYETEKVEVFDRYLFFNDGDSVIKIYDISDPLIPVFISKVTGTGCKNFKILGDYIFTSHNSISNLFSLTNIINPVKIGELIINDEITIISAYPPFIYIGTKNIGIRRFLYDSFDIMPPRYPKNIYVNGNVIPEWSNDDSFLITFEHYFDDTLPDSIFFKFSKPPYFRGDTSFTIDYNKVNFITPRKEGIDTIYLWFSDTLSNVDYRLNKFFIIKYDSTKPFIPELISFNKYFISVFDTFHWLTSFDSLSGISKYLIQFDTISFFASPFLTDTLIDTFYYNCNIIKNRNVFWRVFAIDSADNVSLPSNVLSFYIDNIPPSFPESVTVDGFNLISLWKKDSIFKVDLYGHDTSGISRILLKHNSQPLFNYDTTCTFDTFPFNYKFIGEGVDSVWIWLVDGVGNTDFNNSTFFILRRDTTPPDTLYNLSLSPSNWTSQDTFILRWGIPYDLSGIERLHFKINEIPSSVYDTSFTITLDTTLILSLNQNGKHHLYIWGIDSAGNSSIDKLNVPTIKIDKIKPEEPELLYPVNNTFVNDKPIFRWTIPYDSISGIKGYVIYIDTLSSLFSPIVTETTYFDSIFISKELPLNKFIFWAVSAFDSAQNFSDKSETFSFFIDNLPPQKPESIFIDGNYLVSRWKKDSIFDIRISESVIPSKSDTSGIKRILYKIGHYPEFNFDTTGSAITSPFNLKFKGEGIETLWVWLIDRAGNADYNNSSFGIIKRDTTPPDTLLFLSISPTGWTSNDTFTIKYKVPKDLSGFYNISLKMNVLPSNSYDTTLTSFYPDSTVFAFSGEGLYNLFLWVFDSAGNSSFNNYQILKIKRDISKPIFSVVSYNDTLFEGDTLKISLGVYDSISGVKDCFLNVNNYSIGKEFLRYFSPVNPDILVYPYEYFGNSSILIKISDFARNSNKISLDYLQYFENIIPRDSFGNPVFFEKNKWFILSSPFPINLKNNFSYLGDYGKDYRIMMLEDTIYNDIEDINKDSLNFGEGIFFKLINEAKIIRFSDGYIHSTSKEYKVPLKKGWNTIGNPFMFPLKMNQIVLKGEPLSYIWGLEGDWVLNNTIKSFTGGLIYSDDEDTLLIYPDTFFKSNDLFIYPYVKIEYFSNNLKDCFNYLILNQIEKRNWVREPPGMNSRISFINDSIRYAIISLDTIGLNILKLEVKEKGNIRFILNGDINDIYIIYEDVLYKLIDVLTLRDVDNEVSVIIGDIYNLQDSLKGRILYVGGTLFKDKIMIEFFAGETNEVEISIFDVSGRILFKKKDIFNYGFNLIYTDISKTGIYFLKITNGNEQILKRILLIK